MDCKLAIFVLMAVCTASAVDRSSRSRCLCTSISQGVPIRLIVKVEIIARSNSCENTEIIAILRNGRRRCLDPATAKVQNVLSRLVERKKAKHFSPTSPSQEVQH
ncbi:C-X-C motif chemokine 10 isoform X2 [Amia ocellicauda]|uniref:C-X-C motif chemokine 10 isoform X2 n=1 Tax=Amia ocellicauda TaxID=2972642 RepID=UPI003463B9F3